MDILNSFEEFKVYIDSLSPMDIEKFVYEMFLNSGRFAEVTLNPIINNRQIDIALVEKSDSPRAKRSFWAVEVKCFRRPVSISVVEAFYGKLLDLQELEPHSNLLVISTSGYTKISVVKAQKLGIFLWGGKELYDLYCKKTIEMSISEPPEYIVNKDLETKVNAFKEALKGIETGAKHWSKYQSLVVDILEFLFCPSLEAPKVELADKDKRNRRDIIFENSSNDDFWKLVRDSYAGHYIVVDQCH